MLTLNDKDTGAPLAYMSANILSAYRTGAVPGVGIKHFAHPDSSAIGIIGPGVMSKTILAAAMAVRPGIKTIKIKGSSPSSKSAKEFARFTEETYPSISNIEIVGTEEEAVRDCDIICIATSSPTGNIEDYPYIKKLDQTRSTVLLPGSRTVR